MCEHEGQPCPGNGCSCECMNCQFPDEEAAAEAAYFDSYFQYQEDLAGDPMEAEDRW